MPKTTNGNVSFLTTATAAGQQAAADVQFFATELGPQPGVKEIAPLVVAGIAGAVATAASAAATLANTAVGIVGLVKDSDDDAAKDALEVEILNNTSQSLVPFNYVPTKCDFTEVAQPLLPTATDSFLLTSGSVGRFSTDTKLTLSFMIGSSAKAIQVDLGLGYASSKNLTSWTAGMKVDGQSQAFPQQLQIMGAQFIGNSGYPSFSVYVTPVESTTGKITVAFYDTQTS